MAQLCKQVERAATGALEGEWTSDALLGAAVGSVEPAPDGSRLRVLVVLAPAKATSDVEQARAALVALTPAFREEVARSIHRKRVPEIVFEVVPSAEVDRG